MKLPNKLPSWKTILIMLMTLFVIFVFVKTAPVWSDWSQEWVYQKWLADGNTELKFKPMEDQFYEQHTQRDKEIDVMVKYWFSQEEAEYIHNYCSTMNNPDWCVRLATHTARHETKNWELWVGRPHMNNLFWITSCISPTDCRYKAYYNRMASFEDWVERYNRLWHKNNCEQMITRSRYTNTKKAEWISNCEWMMNNFR